MYMKILLIITVLSWNLLAEESGKLKVNIGTMLITNFSTQMQISPHRSPISILIDTKENLGIDYQTGVFRIDGEYRFTQTHSIDFSYYSVKSDGSKSVQKEFTWGDTTIGSGAAVQAYFNMDIYKVNYGYSFYHNDKVELMLTAGLHITTVALGLAATGNVRDENGTLVAGIYSESTSGTLPLPVFGFKGEYSISKNLFANYRSEYFALKFDKYKGSYISNTISFEYKFATHYGFGFGYNANRLYVEGKGENANFEVENTLSGFIVNLSYTY